MADVDTRSEQNLRNSTCHQHHKLQPSVVVSDVISSAEQNHSWPFGTGRLSAAINSDWSSCLMFLWNWDEDEWRQRVQRHNDGFWLMAIISHIFLSQCHLHIVSGRRKSHPVKLWATAVQFSWGVWKWKFNPVARIKCYSDLNVAYKSNQHFTESVLSCPLYMYMS